jgi:hypothetical protein
MPPICSANDEGSVREEEMTFGIDRGILQAASPEEPWRCLMRRRRESVWNSPVNPALTSSQAVEPPE